MIIWAQRARHCFDFEKFGNLLTNKRNRYMHGPCAGPGVRRPLDWQNWLHWAPEPTLYFLSNLGDESADVAFGYKTQFS